MTEVPSDPIYAASRRTLLDALEALQPHLSSLVLVGAQAVYLRTEKSSLGIAPFTSDADLIIDPSTLTAAPPIGAAMEAGGFTRTGVGEWSRPTTVSRDTGDTVVDVVVDLLVPAEIAPGTGRRGVDLAGHERLATRRTLGLEAALVDHDQMVIQSLDSTDSRYFRIEVAGPAGLLVAKIHKIVERAAEPGTARLNDKDAADIYRMFQVVDARDMESRLNKALVDPVSRDVTRTAVDELRRRFGQRGGAAIAMVQRAVRLSGPQASEIEALCIAYIGQLQLGS